MVGNSCYSNKWMVPLFTLNPPLTGVLLAVIPIVAMGAVQYCG